MLVAVNDTPTHTIYVVHDSPSSSSWHKAETTAVIALEEHEVARHVWQCDACGKWYRRMSDSRIAGVAATYREQAMIDGHDAYVCGNCANVMGYCPLHGYVDNHECEDNDG